LSRLSAESVQQQPRFFLSNWSSTQNLTKDPMIMTHQHIRLQQASFTNRIKHGNINSDKMSRFTSCKYDKRHLNMSRKANHVACV